MNYPDGCRFPPNSNLADVVQDDVDRLYRFHSELTDVIRRMADSSLGLDRGEVTEFLVVVDEHFSDLCHKFLGKIQEETGVRVPAPISPEYADWLRRNRPVKVNPQTIKDIEEANRVAGGVA